jgi:hypothetical protein
MIAPSPSAAQVLELGARFRAAARRPRTDLYYFVTQAAGDMAPATLHVVRRAGAHLTTVLSRPLAVRAVRALAFDDGGRWLLIAAASGFYAVRIGADDAPETARALGTCDSYAFVQAGDAFLGTCASENRLMRFDATADGPASARAQLSFPMNYGPGVLLEFGANVLVQGRKMNGVAGSENRVALVMPGATAVASSVVLKAPWMSNMSGAYATVAARHPRLSVAYFVNGASWAYHGQSVAVVALMPAGLAARQYVRLPSDNSYSSGSYPFTGWTRPAAAREPGGRAGQPRRPG